jgi:polyisoprenoid-binding protein YceI
MSTIQTLTKAPAGTWRLDPVHSHVGFEIDYLGGTFKGQFREVDAQLQLEDGRARLEGAAEVASVDAKDENLAEHLQAPDFFDAERHPQLRFSAEPFALDAGELTLDGEITIKGVTRPVTVTGTAVAPAVDPHGRERVGLKAATTVDRTEFGVSWNASLPGGGQALSNDVAILAELYFVRE